MTDQKAITPYEALKNTLQSSAVVERFEQLLGKRAPVFMASILSLSAQNKALTNCSPGSVLTSAAKAAALDLPIEPALGMAHIVPFGKDATFIIGYKGLLQLAIRSAQYEQINIAPVYQGEHVKQDRLKGDMTIEGEPVSDEIVGVAGYFRTKAGLEKSIYWNVDKIRGHGEKFSKTYNNNSSPWKTHFEAMAKKTVLRELLKWGPLSIEYQDADAAPMIDEAGISVPDFSDAIEGESADIIEQSEFYAAVVEAQYSNNEHNVKAALKHSTNYFESAAEMVAWFKLYRAHKDTGKDTATAASMADAGEVPA